MARSGHRRASIAALAALVCAAAGMQAFGVGPAAAMVSSGASKCFPLPGSSTSGQTASGRPCTLIGGGGSAPQPIKGNEVIKVQGTLPTVPPPAPNPPACTLVSSCLPSGKGRNGLSLKRDQSSQGGQTRAGAGSPTKDEKKQEERRRLETCRMLLRESSRWDEAAVEWYEFVNEMREKGVDPNNPLTPDDQKAGKRLRQNYEGMRRSVKLDILMWQNDKCGPVPLKWQVLAGSPPAT